MKKYILAIMIAFSFFQSNAQPEVHINTYNIGNNDGKYFKDLDNNYGNFTGTWENTTGIITFRLTLWKFAKKPMGYPTKYYKDSFEGKFLIIKNAGMPNEIILHNSVKYYPQNNYTSTSVIYASAYDGRDLGGNFEDSCANGGNGFLSGFFYLYIENPGVSPSIARWKIKNAPRIQGQYYSIPMDVLMTKIN